MIDRISVPGLIKEMQEACEDYDKKYFRQKVLRVYMKCLKSNRIKLAVAIATKYRKELTEPVRSDMAISQQYALFASNIINKKQ
jgi:hypothetical protein